MKSSKLSVIVLWSILVAAVVGAGIGIIGCKQGLNERCQINTDCEPPLVCTVDQLCESGTGAGADANLPIDAPRDAMVDAKPDAHADAHLDAPHD